MVAVRPAAGIRRSRELGRVLDRAGYFCPLLHRQKVLETLLETLLGMKKPQCLLGCLVEPRGFEPRIPPCHGGVIPFHYGPGITDQVVRRGTLRTAR